ncbi:hypothetical protein ACQP25_44725 (plasmid) [Microtetraspora malaysiensis]|uniref:hypothetical protein n=1 Tax=Microtetraspora malaysiensis TaxID=161358 RepID=UPI003D8E1C13
MKHAYAERAGVMVRVCMCGKWPAHHAHLGESRSTCGCDECQWIRSLAKPDPLPMWRPWVRQYRVVFGREPGGYAWVPKVVRV